LCEIEKLCEKSYGKLDSSKLLYENGKYSDSASLAYYSMFLMAKALLMKKDFDAKTHDGILHLFSLKYVHEDSFKYRLYAYLSAAQSVREDADYNISDYINQEIAEELILQAEEFLKEAERFL